MSDLPNEPHSGTRSLTSAGAEWTELVLLLLSGGRAQLARPQGQESLPFPGQEQEALNFGSRNPAGRKEEGLELQEEPWVLLSRTRGGSGGCRGAEPRPCLSYTSLGLGNCIIWDGILGKALDFPAKVLGTGAEQPLERSCGLAGLELAPCRSCKHAPAPG